MRIDEEVHFLLSGAWRRSSHELCLNGAYAEEECDSTNVVLEHGKIF